VIIIFQNDLPGLDYDLLLHSAVVLRGSQAVDGGLDPSLGELAGQPVIECRHQVRPANQDVARVANLARDRVRPLLQQQNRLAVEPL
jgi:hypothetical protein